MKKHGKTKEILGRLDRKTSKLILIEKIIEKQISVATDKDLAAQRQTMWTI